jgi:hypothetical protein
LDAGPDSHASGALAAVSADQAATMRAAARPTWVTAGMALCVGVLVGASGVTSWWQAIVVFAVLVAEVALFVAWRRSMKVHLRLRQRFDSLPIAGAIMVGLFVVAFGLMLVLSLPSWSPATLRWLAPVCGVVSAVVFFAVGRWNTGRWLAKMSR